ncbi:unnamed protein product [Urochloa humidicola]
MLLASSSFLPPPQPPPLDLAAPPPPSPVAPSPSSPPWRMSQRHEVRAVAPRASSAKSGREPEVTPQVHDLRLLPRRAPPAPCSAARGVAAGNEQGQVDSLCTGSNR